MLAALVKALGVVGVNVGDMLTEVCSTFFICLPEFEALQEIIELLAG